MSKKSFILVVLVLVACLISGCASPTIVETRKNGDADLSCSQIQNEILDAEAFEKKAREERTVTGGNVARAIFFWPALVGTYANTEEAINAAKERKELLKRIGASKFCNLY
jgi:hypothetical protein